MESEYDTQSFVNVAQNSDSDDIMELPQEKDGTILLSTVQAQFPTAIGLKYKSASGGWRGIRLADNVLDPPSAGWGDTIFVITESNSLKRKSTDDHNGHAAKSKKTSSLLDDIIVLGLPYATTEEELKEYFASTCGELAYHEIKYDRDTKKSRGFGFIRFKTEEAAKEAINGHHTIDNRKLEVRLSKKKDNPMKLFIGRLPGGTTRDDVEKYFSEFGELVDVFVPNPFRGFAFVTYAVQEEAMKTLRMTHLMGGTRLNVTPAEPKEDKGPGRQENYGVSNYSWNSHNAPNNSWNGSQNNRYQEPPQKDVTSELKDMLLTLISQK